MARHPSAAWLAAVAIAVAAPRAGAVEILDPFAGALNPPSDLAMPDQPTAFGYQAGQNRMFKPDGAGPFPGLVLMPTCGGHNNFMNTFDWAKRALAQGYAVVVVDPLKPRDVSINCTAPLKVTPSRLFKDAMDAASHLRKQSFVDPERIGLMGFSQGAMVGLGAAGAKHSRDHGGTPFQAIVSAYPVCIARNLRSPITREPAEAHYASAEIVVPILVEMGEQDTEGYPKDCIPTLDEAKAKGAPVEYRLYKGATHAWDATETRNQPFSKLGLEGQRIVYRYDGEVTEQSAKDAFAFLDARLKKK
jgi:dienelactone hydrolase